MSDQEQEQPQPPQRQSQPGIEQEMTPEPDPGPRADPIPDVFSGQDPKVDQVWRRPRRTRWAASPPRAEMLGSYASLGAAMTPRHYH